MSKTFRYKTNVFGDEEWQTKRDKKRLKPGRTTKYHFKMRRKAKEKQALYRNPDLIPEFPNEDESLWDGNYY